MGEGGKGNKPVRDGNKKLEVLGIIVHIQQGLIMNPQIREGTIQVVVKVNIVQQAERKKRS